jgi:hypothetical protein
MLVYDTAGTTFSVYNSFARIYTESFDYPITNACFAKDGRLAIVTREADSKAVVYVYNDDFEKLAKYKVDSYMFDIAIDSSRELIAFVYYGVGNGIGQTIISFRNLNTLEETAVCKFDGEFPLECRFIGNDSFAIVTDSAVRIIDNSLESEASEAYDYLNGNVTGYSINDSGITVSVTVVSKNEVIAFDSKGKLLYNDIVQAGVTDIGLYADKIFLQTENGIIRLDTKSNEEEILNCGNGKLLVYNQDTVLVCGEAKAEYLVFGK